MTNNFFDLVKDGFFNPFVNSNKRYNYDLLLVINNKMSLDNLLVTKDDIVEWIVDYVDNCPIDMLDDETNNIERDVRAFAFEKVRYFVKCGWLIEDFEGMKITYQLDENGIKILAAMENAVKDDTKSLEFSGYVYNIYNNLYWYNSEHAVDIIEQVYKSSKELNSMLRGLNVNIKKFLTKLISENKAMPREILETIFFDYQKKVVIKAFKNFREKDNPSRYKLYIENKIDELLSSKQLEMMINNYLKVKFDSATSVEYYCEAKDFFETRLNYIRNQFEDIEEYIQMLDKRNTKYITTAQSRLNFLLNEETDIEGRIIDCLKSIADIDSEDFFKESCVELYSSLNIDENSLYNPVSRRAKPSPELIEDYEINPKDIEKLSQMLFKNNIYSVSEINKFVLEKLGNANKIQAIDIKTSDFSDILKIFLVQIFSGNKEIDYTVTYLDESYKALGYKLKNYIIERKEF